MPQPRSREREADAPGPPRLLAVLLVDALETLGRKPHGAPAREVRDWVCAGGADDGSCSFTRACGTLGLSPVRLRRRLGLRGRVPRRPSPRGWTRRARAPHPPVA